MICSDAGRHHKPHFHVMYAGYEASVGVDGEIDVGPDFLYDNSVALDKIESA